MSDERPNSNTGSNSKITPELYYYGTKTLKQKFYLRFHYNGANSYLFVNGTEIHKFKARDSEIVLSPLCLGNISKYYSVDNMEKTRLNE